MQYGYHFVSEKFAVHEYFFDFTNRNIDDASVGTKSFKIQGFVFWRNN